jgi:hypothetical protein
VQVDELVLVLLLDPSEVAALSAVHELDQCATILLTWNDELY